MNVTEVLQAPDWSSVLLQPSSGTDPQDSGRNTAVLSASFSWTAAAWCHQIHETCKYVITVTIVTDSCSSCSELYEIIMNGTLTSG